MCIGVLGSVCRHGSEMDGSDGFGLEMDVLAGGLLLVVGFLFGCHYTCTSGRWCGNCWIWVLEVICYGGD